MAHDASVVQLGTTVSSAKEVDNLPGTVEAGLIARMKSDGKVSKLAADGNAIGISLGRDMGGAGHTAVCRKGLSVPLQLTDGFTPVVGAQVNISDTTGMGAAAGAGVTAVNATYASGLLVGKKEIDGSDVDAALIDFPGGL